MGLVKSVLNLSDEEQQAFVAAEDAAKKLLEALHTLRYVRGRISLYPGAPRDDTVAADEEAAVQGHAQRLYEELFTLGIQIEA